MARMKSISSIEKEISKITTELEKAQESKKKYIMEFEVSDD